MKIKNIKTPSQILEDKKNKEEEILNVKLNQIIDHINLMYILSPESDYISVIFNNLLYIAALEDKKLLKLITSTLEDAGYINIAFIRNDLNKSIVLKAYLNKNEIDVNN